MAAFPHSAMNLLWVSEPWLADDECKLGSVLAIFNAEFPVVVPFLLTSVGDESVVDDQVFLDALDGVGCNPSPTLPFTDDIAIAFFSTHNVLSESTLLPLPLVPVVLGKATISTSLKYFTHGNDRHR